MGRLDGVVQIPGKLLQAPYMKLASQIYGQPLQADLYQASWAKHIAVDQDPQAAVTGRSVPS